MNEHEYAVLFLEMKGDIFMPDGNLLIELNEITKVFPGMVAVDKVNLKINKGEVHIIIGENGAGKSTLVKMMAGIYPVDGGSMTMEGEPYLPQNVKEAQAKGINMIHQELNVMSNRTVAQNVFVGREPTKGFLGVVDTKKMNEDCKKLLDGLEIDIEPAAYIRDLSIAQRQMVEAAKAISTNNKLLIMDEPTSSLTYTEIENLFRMTRRLKSEGMAIIYISHRMQELMEIGDVVTVMRDGAYVATKSIKEVDMDEIIYMMVGRKIENVYNRTYNEPGEIVLETKDLAAAQFRNVNINVRAGEIVGFAGLVGAGRSEVCKAIDGFDKIESGDVILNGKKINGKGYDTKQAVDHHISFVPEDRKLEGCCINMSIQDNIVMSALPYLFKRFFINGKTISEKAKEGIEKLNVITTSKDKLVSELSGGNQQKVVIAKWMLSKSNVFIFDEPTRGIDVGAKSEIYVLMNELAKQGAAILMVSSDLQEIIGLADRIYVMRDGEVSGEVQRDEFSQEYILGFAMKGGNNNG